MRVLSILLSLMSCSALVVVPLHPPRTIVTFSSARVRPSMGFEDSIAALIDGVSAFFEKSTRMLGSWWKA